MNLERNKPVAIWLFIGAAMIIIQVLLGGLTRLTNSGLSITEWQPILGALPPMNEKAWQEAFEKYQQLAQFKYLHNHFTLEDFKFIYFWEWFHRQWARLMGFVFLVPFIYFIYKKWINKTMLWPMVILFLLGGLQGLIGWLMVKSGVGTDLVFVDHTRLAIHFIAALVLLCYVIWFGMKLIVPNSQLQLAPQSKNMNIIILIVLTLQLVYGAFMAGSHAGKAAITWPSINGEAVPVAMLKEGGFWFDITHNLITIQFIHRGLAYLLAILVIFFTLQLVKQRGTQWLRKAMYWPLLLVIVQVILGVITLIQYLTDNKLLLSIIHQFVGMMLLVSLTVTAYLLRKKVAS